MEKLLDSCQLFYQKTLGYMHLQILTSIIFLIALFVIQQQLFELKSSIHKSTDIIKSENVKQLKAAWSLDNLILAEIGNDYRSNTIKNASELAILITVHTALLAEGQEENKKFKQTFNLIGELSQKLNRYRQALIALEKAAAKGTDFDDFNIQLLDHYRSYLDVENGKAGFDKGWTTICKLASAFNTIRKKLVKSGSIKKGSIYEKLSKSKRVVNLLDWGEKQLVKQSEIPGDVISGLEQAGTDTTNLITDFISRITQSDKVEKFRTIRQESINLTYGFKSQLEANPNTVNDYKKQLNGIGSSSLRQLQRNLDRDKKKMETLLEDEKIPLPFTGISIPVSLINWILPLTNLVFLGLIFQARRKAMSLVELLDQEHYDVFIKIQTQFLNYTEISKNTWLWSIHRDTVGCFGLSIVVLYQFSLSLDFNKFSIVAIFTGIYFALVFLNIYLWKYVLKNYDGVAPNAI